MDERQAAEVQIVARALKDRAFRKALLADPKTTIEKELEIELPGRMKIHVVQESAGSLYLVLPYHPDEVDLLDEEVASAMMIGDVCSWTLCSSSK